MSSKISRRVSVESRRSNRVCAVIDHPSTVEAIGVVLWCFVRAWTLAPALSNNATIAGAASPTPRAAKCNAVRLTVSVMSTSAPRARRNRAMSTFAGVMIPSDVQISMGCPQPPTDRRFMSAPGCSQSQFSNNSVSPCRMSSVMERGAKSRY